MRARTCALLVLPAVSLALFAPVSAAPQARVTLVGPGGPGFFAYDLMAGLAQVATVPNVTLAVEATAGFLDSMQRIAQGRAQAGIVGSVIVVDAALGEEAFRGSRVPLRTLAALHDFVYYLVAFEDSGIRMLTDLRGKRVGIAGPGDVRDALRWLRAAALDPDRDLRWETFQAPGVWVAALRENRVDAVFATSLGSPAIPDVTELSSTPGRSLRIVPLDGILPGVRKEYGERYHAFTIPQGLYRGVSASVPTISAGAYLIARTDLDTDVAYQITKHFYERRGELARFSYAAQYVTVVGLSTRSAVPFHPGAIRYFRERGVPGF